jgi:3',5'-cyclic AMP phosphodiesterase CpdA
MTEKKSFKLAHLSDLHLFSSQDLNLTELLNKRMLGYFSWRLHRHAVHRDDVLAALVRNLHALNPDHIVITGDLTHLGTPSQFRMAQQFLNRMGLPAKVTVIPGNHDAYVKTAWKETFALWADYMISDEKTSLPQMRTNLPVEFPSLRVRGRVAVIGVTTARPSAPFLAVGSIGPTQLRRLEKMLNELGRRQLFRVVLIHHPPVSGVVKWRKRLTDAAAFRTVVNRCGAELILHGHVHRKSFTYLNATVDQVPVISVPSASALSQNPERQASYHVYHINPSSRGFNIKLSVRGYSAKKNQFIAEGEYDLKGSIL